MYSHIKKIPNHTCTSHMLPLGQELHQHMVHQENMSQNVGQNHGTMQEKFLANFLANVEYLQ